MNHCWYVALGVVLIVSVVGCGSSPPPPVPSSGPVTTESPQEAKADADTPGPLPE